VSQWRESTLEDAAVIEYGDRVVRSRDAGSKFPVYGGGGATFFVDRTNRRDRYIVSRFGMSENCVRYVGDEFFLNDSGLTVSTRDEEVLSQSFLELQLLALQNQIFGLGTGAAQQNLDVSKFRMLVLRWPSNKEQKRIVAMIDEMTKLAKEAERLLSVSSERARSLITSSVDSLIGSLDCETVRLDSVCATFTDGDWVESKDQSTTGIRLVQTGNVGSGFFKDRRDKARWISDATFTALRCTEVRPGDVLISRLPDPVGRACVIPKTGDRMITAVDCTIARPRPDSVSPDFLVLCTMTTPYADQIRAKVTGATRSRISRSNLGSIGIPLPSAETQAEIVEQAQNIARLADECVQNAEARLRKVHELQHSILESAFRGEL
jgi:restriction endonuclease S subunit